MVCVHTCVRVWMVACIISLRAHCVCVRVLFVAAIRSAINKHSEADWVVGCQNIVRLVFYDVLYNMVLHTYCACCIPGRLVVCATTHILCVLSSMLLSTYCTCCIIWYYAHTVRLVFYATTHIICCYAHTLYGVTHIIFPDLACHFSGNNSV